VNLLNDTLGKFITVLSGMSGNPFIDSLEHGNNYYTLASGINSSDSLLSGVGNLGTHGFKMTGGGSTQTSWPSSTGTSTTGHQAFSYSDHVASINACVNASAFPSNNLYLSFDLKETYYYGAKYTYFAVVVNGTDTLSDITGAKFFNPVTTSSDPFATKVFNLSAFAGTNFALEFVSACKYNDATGGGTGNDVFLDNIALSTKPVVNLGPDATICSNTSAVLDAGAAPNGYTYSYIWSTLHAASIATTETITVDSAATYIASVNNGYGVTTNDTIKIAYYMAPVISLGHDTTNCGSYILNPGGGYASYLWSTGASTSTITVTTNNTYSVIVTNVNGCTASASANVIIIPFATASTSPQSVCYLDTLQIAYATAANYDSLLWTSLGDGHFILDSTIILPKYKPGVNDTTIGSVKLILTVYSKCDTISDTLHVTLTKTATASAGSNQSVCPGMCTTLSASGGNSYVWSPILGLSDPNISNPLACPSAYSIYTVTATSSCGTASASVDVSINQSPVINVTPPNPAICSGNSATLTATGASTYIWTGGLTANPVIVIPSSTTTYMVTGTDVSGCTASTSETVTVDHITAPKLGNDTIVCAGTSVSLNAGIGYDSYLWSTGTTNQTVTVDSSTAHTGIGIINVYVDVTKGACAITSNTIGITFADCTGIVEYSNNANISLFPNPATGMVNIVLNGISGNAVMNIYSIQGQEVLNKELNGNLKTELDLSGLSKGIYLIRITNEKINLFSKLIVQ